MPSSEKSRRHVLRGEFFELLRSVDASHQNDPPYKQAAAKNLRDWLKGCQERVPLSGLEVADLLSDFERVLKTVEEHAEALKKRRREKEEKHEQEKAADMERRIADEWEFIDQVEAPVEASEIHQSSGEARACDRELERPASSTWVVVTATDSKK